MIEALKNDYKIDLATPVTPAGDDFEMYVTPRFAPVYSSGYEQLSTRLIKALAAKADIFVDVGAHYGYYSLLAGTSNEQLSVIAIEPVRENLLLMEHNFKHNQFSPNRYQCINAAVSDSSGQTEFCISEASDNCSIYPHPRSETLERVLLNKVSLDDVIAREIPRRLLIKTDTDGHELQVLKGLLETLDFHSDISILMEINPKMLAIAQQSVEEIHEFLLARGFRIFAIDDQNQVIQPIDDVATLKILNARFRTSYYNVLCLKASGARSLVLFSHSAQLGGAERSLEDLARGFIREGAMCNVVVPHEGAFAERIRTSGCGVIVASPSLANAWLCASTHPGNGIDVFPAELHEEFASLVRNVATLRPDFIISQTIVSPWGALCAEALDLPHAVSAREYGERDHGFKFDFGYAETLASFYETSDVVLSITHDVSQSLFAEDPLQKSTVIYSGIEKRVTADPAPSFESLFPQANGPLFLLPAAYHPGKGQEEFVRAALELLAEGVAVRCLMIGPQPDEQYFGAVEQLIEESEYADQFCCLGYSQNIMAIMGQADCVVSCSPNEALGRTLIEASLLEVPIIFPTSAGPGEVFSGGVHGLAYTPGDASGLADCMRRIAQMPDEARAMAREARLYCETCFSMETYARKALGAISLGRSIGHPERRASAKPFEKLINGRFGFLVMRNWEARCYVASEESPFNDSDFVQSACFGFGEFCLSFTVPQHNITQVRFDPVEGTYIEIRGFDYELQDASGVTISNSQLTLTHNGVEEGDRWVFHGDDPQICFASTSVIRYLKVWGHMAEVSKRSLMIIAGLFVEAKEQTRLSDVKLSQIGTRLLQLEGAHEQTLHELQMKMREHEEFSSALQSEVALRDASILALMSSTSWKSTAPLRFIGHQTKRVRLVAGTLPAAIKSSGGLAPLMRKAWRLYRREGFNGLRRGLVFVQTQGRINPTVASGPHDRNDYAEWIRRFDTLTDSDRLAMSDRIGAMPRLPLISVVMPTYNPPIELLDEAIWSVRRQLYPAWELCIADDASSDPRVKELLSKHSREDERVKILFRNENGHISRATNSALTLSTGEYIALMDNDDLLTEHALYWVAETVLENPDAGLIYSDEDKLSMEAERFGPYFKCEYNAELMLSHNMICHLGVYRKDLVDMVQGFRTGFEGAQDYDLALRVIELLKPDHIIHIPRILYHWRAIPGSTASEGSAKDYAAEAARRAVSEHLERIGIPAEVHPSPIAPGMLRVRYMLPDALPTVSIIIPTRDRIDLLSVCIASIRDRSTYPFIEIVVVDNGSTEQKTFQYFESVKAEGVKVLRSDEPFNFSRLNNLGAREATGEILCLMNNDIEITVPDWAEEMVSYACRSEIGCVGARLLYPNGGLQHGGVILGVGGVAGHSHKYAPASDFGYFGRAVLAQSLSAVTGACLMIRRDVYEQVGGLDESFAVAFNDVDFCLRVRAAGYRNVWTPFAEMIHHESVSRGLEDNPEKIARFNGELNRMIDRWSDTLLHDPAYSPNLTLDHEDFSLAWPPRLERQT